MEIDRARFFELMTAFAAAGTAATACEPAAQPTPINVPVEPTGPASASAVASAPPPTAKKDREPPSDPPPSSLPTGAGIWAGPAPSGAPQTCAALRCPLSAPWREAFQVLLHDCRSLEAGLRPEPFQRVVGCLLSQNNTRTTCDLIRMSDSPGDCLEGWASPPALDPATEPKCRRLVGSCAARTQKTATTISLEACQGILSVTSPRGEPKMISCITEYCGEAPKLCYLAYP